MDNLITAIDLGTSKVTVIICEIDKNSHLQVIGVGSSPCKGIKKGVVVDIDETSNAISNALKQAENMADAEVDCAYVNIPGGYTKIIRNKGIIAVSGENREINMDDVKRVLNSATIISMPQDQQIIDIIPNQYIIDGYDEIKDPIGMVGVRLEADVQIVTGSTTAILNLIKSVNSSGIDVLGIVPEPFSEAESILSKDERELGVLLIDMGAGTTDVSLFKNDQLVYSKLIPIAGSHITNDISVGLRISYKESEEIKKRYGIAYTPLAKDKDSIDINPIGMNEKVNITQSELSEVIEARVSEIFDIINMELVRSGFKQDILTDVVITGGGASYFPGIKELSKEIFNLPVRIGLPDSIGVKEPIFSTSLGLIKYSFKRKFNYFIEYNNVDAKKGKAKGNSNRNIFSLFKKMWEEYF